MNRRVILLLALAAGVAATFLAKALGYEGVISRAATFAVVIMLITGLGWQKYKA